MSSTDTTDTRHGVGVSPGVAVGPVVQVRRALVAPADEPAPDDVDAAKAQLAQTLEAVAQTLEAKAASAGPEAQAILFATTMMARDPGLLAGAGTHLDAGHGLANAISLAVEEYCTVLEAAGGYMAERVTDLRDVKDRAVSRLLGSNDPGVPDLREPSVLVAYDLAPSETVTLDRESVLAIVTEAGGRTSHTAILAAQMGIPAIVQVPGATQLATGMQLAVDGSTGAVVVDPSDEDARALTDRAAARAELLASSHGSGATSDGHPVALLANIGTVKDAEEAGALDVEGVGLFRTEMLFLDRDDAPGLEEQTATYTKVLAAFTSDDARRRVVVRTLDAGADKPLAFADLGEEENPALGRRGLRLGMERTQLLDTQLQALAAAGKATGADLRVMAPMVATRAEAAWFAERARAAGIAKVGVMVEIPAAAVRASQVLADVDFASIGTNDLSQYTMAADRMLGELSDLLDPWQPAVLDLVKATCDGGAATSSPVGVCGEAAADPLMALVLVGLGVSSLSMSPSRVPAVRVALGLHTLAQCREVADAALTADSADGARAAALAAADAKVAAVL